MWTIGSSETSWSLRLNKLTSPEEQRTCPLDTPEDKWAGWFWSGGEDLDLMELFKSFGSEKWIYASNNNTTSWIATFARNWLTGIIFPGRPAGSGSTCSQRKERRRWGSNGFHSCVIRHLLKNLWQGVAERPRAESWMHRPPLTSRLSFDQNWKWKWTEMLPSIEVKTENCFKSHLVSIFLQ